MMSRTLSIFFLFFFFNTLLRGQIKCNDSLIYWIKGASPFIKVLDPFQPLSPTNPLNTSIPLPPPGINNAFQLALMPNINGGSFSPTFYSVQQNNGNNTFMYWDGNNWISTGHSAGNNNSWLAGLAGCNGALYALRLDSYSGPGIPAQVTIYKYTGTGPALPILSLTNNTNQLWNDDLVTDCNCNFYTLFNASFNKYDPNGVLLSSTPVVGPNIGQRCMATVGNTIFTMGYNETLRWTNMSNSPLSFTNITTGGSINPDDFASCPIDLTTPFTGVILNNTLLCQPSTASLAVTSTVSNLSYTWSGPGLVSASNASVANVNAPGLYTCALSQGACEYNRDTLVATVISNTSLVAPLITPSTNLCFAPGQQLFSSLSSTLFSNQWSGGTVLSGGNSATVSVGAAGVYSLLTTNISNGCAGSATANVLPVPVVSLGLNSNTLCVFSSSGTNSITLNSAGAPGYSLFASPGFTFNTQPSQPVAIYLTAPYPSGGTIGSATLVGSNGVCSASASAGFSVLPVTKISVIPSSTIVCLGNTQSFSASGAITYTWLPTEGNSSSNTGNLSALIAKPVIYSVVGTDLFGCNSFPETVSVSVHPLHKGTLSGLQNIFCVPLSAEFNFVPASISGNSFTSEWAVNNVNYSSSKFSYLFKDAGTYTLNVKVRDRLYQCSNTLSFIIEAYPKPQANFNYTPQEPDEINNEVVFSPLENEGSGFEWFFVNNKNEKSNEKSPSFVFNQTGIYPVALVVKNGWGCEDTVVKAIEVKEDFTFYIPNAFSPNQDGKNEIFLPVSNSIKLYNMKIFNRWGDLVFQTSDPSNGWDGTFKGEPCKEDSYIWKVELSTKQGQHKVFNGHVLMVR